MASTKQQLMNEDDDPYKSEEGHVELKIENFAGFIQEPLLTKRLSDPICVRGVTWKICTILREGVRPNGQKQKCLGCFLHCVGDKDPFWSCSATIKMRILAQKEGSDGNVENLVSRVFHAKDSTGNMGIGKILTFEGLMNPDKGWYDEQSDAITLAVDLTVRAVPEGIDGFVLVAENELKFDKGPSHFSMQLGRLEWEINFNVEKGEKSLALSCKDVAKGRMDKVALELFGYHRDDPKCEAYSPFPEKSAAHHHLFTAKDNSLTIKVPKGCVSNNILFAVRMLIERSQFPDFTKEAVMIGCNAADVKLLVENQQFHVNKQLLSTLSPFFDRMFHGLFDAAKQPEVELDLCRHSPQLFHEFLLVMCVNEALPNSMNVTALFKLADYYDAENVRQKCDQHLRMAREMPIEKRVLLARDHGSGESQALIVDSANFEQSKRINLLLMQNCAI